MTQQRELLLVPFPFSDQSGKKVRPVVVISNDKFNSLSNDLIVMGVTSNLSKELYNINLSSDDLDEGHLHNPCCIKVENILRIHKELIIKSIGKINGKTLNVVLEAFDKIIR